MTVTREAVAAAKPFSDRATRWVGRRAAGPASRDRRRRCGATTPPPNATGCCSTTPSKRSARTGVLGLRVPAEFGGPGGRVARRAGRGHPDRARQFQCGAGASGALRILRAAAEQPRDARPNAREWFPRVNAGLVVGNAITDAAGKAPVERGHHGAAPTPTGVLRLNGYKFYSTGTLFADVIAVSAVDADGQRPAGDHSGRPRRCRTVRRLGRIRPAHHRQRRNAIHRCRRRSRRGDHGVRRQAPRATRTAFLQLYLAAVAVGIAYARARRRGRLRAARRRVRPRTRWPTRAASDPFVLAGRRRDRRRRGRGRSRSC